MGEGHQHPSPRATIANLRQPIPLGRKLRLLLRNLSIRLRTGSTCCGHPGEPGC